MILDAVALLAWLSSHVSLAHLVITAVACFAWLAWCDHQGAQS